ncbi:hypothetical protein HDU98_011306 [Podochytrium sp. JEL0797]|nr:hypothetical protein HDU98_011306 [Podochytrium sp. JEL0797]
MDKDVPSSSTGGPGPASLANLGHDRLRTPSNILSEPPAAAKPALQPSNTSDVDDFMFGDDFDELALAALPLGRFEPPDINLNDSLLPGPSSQEPTHRSSSPQIDTERSSATTSTLSTSLHPRGFGGKFVKREPKTARPKPSSKRIFKDRAIPGSSRMMRNRDACSPVNAFSDTTNFSTSFLHLSKREGISNAKPQTLRDSKVELDKSLSEQEHTRERRESSARSREQLIDLFDSAVLTEDDIVTVIKHLQGRLSTADAKSSVSCEMSASLCVVELQLVETTDVDNPGDLVDLEKLSDCFKASCHHVWSLLGLICQEDDALMTVICSMLAFSFSNKNNYLQQHIGVILRGERASVSLFRLLNAVGLSVSRLTSTRRLDVMASLGLGVVSRTFKPFEWVAIYDNVEREVRKAEKAGTSLTQNRMLSQTMLGLIPVAYDNPLLSSTEPEIRLQDLTPAHILASRSDGDYLKKHLFNLIRTNAIHRYPGKFETLEPRVLYPTSRNNKVSLVPFGLSNHKDMSPQGATRIVEHYFTELGVPAGQNAELVIIGDGGTLTNMRAAKWRRGHDVEFGTDTDKLLPAKPSVGLLHFKFALMGGAVKMLHFSDKLFGTVGDFAKGIDRHLNDKKFDFHSMERVFLAVLEVYIWAVLDEASATVSYGDDAETNCNSLVKTVLVILEESKAYSMETIAILNKKGVATKVDFSFKPVEENPSRNYILQFINFMSMYSIYCDAIRYNDGDGVHSLHKLFVLFFAEFSKGYAVQRAFCV